MDAPPEASIACNGELIAANTTLAEDRVVIVPQRGLPDDATCSVSVPSGFVTRDGSPIAPTTWEFETSDRPVANYEWSTPQELDITGYVYGIVADGDDLMAAAWRAEAAALAVSRNNGRSFGDSLSIPQTSSSIGTLSMYLSDGIGHIAWRRLPQGSQGIGWYTRVVDALTRVEEPRALSVPEGTLNVLTMALGFDGDRQLRMVGTARACNPDCGPGEYSAFAATSDDGGETFVALGEWAGPGVSSLDVAWSSDGMLTGWVEDDRIIVQDESHNELIVPGEDEARQGPLKLLSLSDGRTLMAWQEQYVDAPHPILLSRFEDGSFTDPITILVEPADASVRVCALLSKSRNDELVLLTSVGDLFGPASRSIQLSTNAGDTFSEAHALDFLNDAGNDPIASDSFCPLVALGTDGVAHVVWDREPTGVSGPNQVLYARGVLQAPCAADAE